MKTFYISISGLFCIVLLYACNSKARHEEKIIDTLIGVSNNSVTSTTDTAAFLNNSDEYIDWDSVRINDVLPPISTTKLLYKTLGNPDSIITPNVECVSFYDKPFKTAYFKGSSFELYGDTAVISTINFKQSGITLTAGKLVLSGNTTLADLGKVFPKSVKDKSTVVIDTFGEVISISVNTGKTRAEDAWALFFKDGKLVQMDYWTPC
ncbi:hypothetical protein GCM10027049_28710 [Mucilaginibacter puniceus]